MRETLPRKFPGTNFAFLPADIVTQILNFGLPAPIDVQVIGPNLEANRAYADKLLAKIGQVPGVADARIQQAFNAPTFNVDVDRTRAELVGLTERDVAQNLQDALAGSIQIGADLLAQSEERRVLSDRRADPAILGELALHARKHSRRRSARTSRFSAAWPRSSAGVSHAVVSHYAVRPVIDIFATNNERDLGAVSADIQKILDATARTRRRARPWSCAARPDDDLRLSTSSLSAWRWRSC